MHLHFEIHNSTPHDANLYLLHYYVSQFTVETYCFADGWYLFKQPQSVIYHCNQYDEEIPSVRLSVCLFVTLKKVFSIINSRTIIRISGERAYNPLQENEAIFSKKYLNFFFVLV